MSPIVSPSTRLRFDDARVDAGFWPDVAARIARWCAVQGVNLRDVVVLLPYAGLLPPLREAFAGHRGMAAAHRDHTHAVCVAGAGPRRRGRAGQLRSGHRPADRRHDAALTGQPGRLGSGAMRVPSMPPSRRWSMRRTRCCAAPMTVRPICAMRIGRPPGEALAPIGGPGAGERGLARVALEWAAAADAPAQDGLVETAPRRLGRAASGRPRCAGRGPADAGRLEWHTGALARHRRARGSALRCSGRSACTAALAVRGPRGRSAGCHAGRTEPRSIKVIRRSR